MIERQTRKYCRKKSKKKFFFIACKERRKNSLFFRNCCEFYVAWGSSVKKWRFFFFYVRGAGGSSSLFPSLTNALRLLRAMNVVWGYVIKIKWNIVFIVCDSLKIANVHHSVNFHLGKLRHRTGDINMNSTLYCRLPLSLSRLRSRSVMCVTFGHCTHRAISSIHENYLHKIWFIGRSYVRVKNSSVCQDNFFVLSWKKKFWASNCEKLHFAARKSETYEKKKKSNAHMHEGSHGVRIIGRVLVCTKAQTYFPSFLFSNNRRRCRRQ